MKASMENNETSDITTKTVKRRSRLYRKAGTGRCEKCGQLRDSVLKASTLCAYHTFLKEHPEKDVSQTHRTNADMRKATQ